MKNPFKSAGFDSIISSGTTIFGNIQIPENETLVVNGGVSGMTIDGSAGTLIVNGAVSIQERITVQNLVVTGKLACDLLQVQGTLAVRNGATLTARLIHYVSLTVDRDAILNGQMIKSKDAAEFSSAKSKSEPANSE